MASAAGADPGAKGSATPASAAPGGGDSGKPIDPLSAIKASDSKGGEDGTETGDEAPGTGGAKKKRGGGPKKPKANGPA